MYLFYVRYYWKRKPVHPFGPADGKPDTCFPRPLYEDLQRMQEEEKE